ncbi:MAG: protein kinase [Myxococcota bacterium]
MTTPEAPKTRRKVDRLVGTVLADKYTIIKKIGEGGMGSVYIANQRPIDRKVAVKVLLGKLAEDEISVRRFEQEARAISRMQHPNTVTIYDFGRTEDDQGTERLYIVMEYLKGRTLTQVLRADGQLAGPRASRIVRQVCASLADAHGAGIVHRDLKPDNIFLTEVGSDRDWVKVLDFGVAKLADSESAGTLTQTGMIFGTPKYMSPEQAEGRPIDNRADIYALGVILFELLVGRPPFVADTPVGLLLKHISDPPPKLSQIRPDLQVDPRLESVVMKALAKHPKDRFQVVGDLAAELEAFERAVTSGYAIPTGTVPTPMAQGLPTEVVPGPGEAATPEGLRSPDALPANLSADVALPDEGNVTNPDRSLATHALSPGHATVGSPGPTVQAPTRRSSRIPMLVAVALVFAIAGLAAVPFFQTAPQSSAVTGVQSLEREPEGTKPPEDVVEEPQESPKTEDETTSDSVAAIPPDPKTERRQAPAKASSDPKESRPTPPSQVTVRFESDPPDAVVWLGREQIGKTPFTRPFERGIPMKVRFRKKGYQPRTRRLRATEGVVVSVRLVEAKPSAERAAQAEPPPVDPSANQKVLDLK